MVVQMEKVGAKSYPSTCRLPPSRTPISSIRLNRWSEAYLAKTSDSPGSTPIPTSAIRSGRLPLRGHRELLVAQHHARGVERVGRVRVGQRHRHVQVVRLALQRSAEQRHDEPRVGGVEQHVAAVALEQADHVVDLVGVHLRRDEPAVADRLAGVLRLGQVVVGDHHGLDVLPFGRGCHHGGTDARRHRPAAPAACRRPIERTGDSGRPARESTRPRPFRSPSSALRRAMPDRVSRTTRLPSIAVTSAWSYGGATSTISSPTRFGLTADAPHRVQQLAGGQAAWLRRTGAGCHTRVHHVDVDGQEHSVGVLRRQRDRLGQHLVQPAALDLGHLEATHALLGHPGQLRRLGPVAAQADLEELAALDRSGFDHPAHRQTVAVERAELDVAGVGVRVEMDHRDPAVAEMLGQAGDVGHRDGVVATEHDRDLVGLGQLGDDVLQRTQRPDRLGRRHLDVAGVDHAHVQQRVDPQRQVRAGPGVFGIVDGAQRHRPHPGAGAVGGA